MAENWTVDWKVEIAGQDLTASWRSVLQSISINDQAGEASDSCDLTLDDTGGQIRLPSKRMPLSVSLNGARVFSGFVDKVKSAGSRSSGRTLNINAKGFDSGGKAKEPQSFHLDDTDLGTYLGKLAERAGLKISVDPDLAGYVQDYWSADAESLISVGQQMARKFGGTFKIRGDQAILAKRGSMTAPSGSSLPVVEAVWGSNLIDWSIAPRVPRRLFGAGEARWFDRASAQLRTTKLDFSQPDFPALNFLRHVLARPEEADAVLDARKREGEWEGGDGTVTLDLTIAAVVEGQCRVSGARAGVDGTYLIGAVKHNANRSGGATTSLSLKQPGGRAGKDDRRAGDPASGFSLPAHETLG